MIDIHPTAIISDKATIGKNVKIGPYCCIGEHVTLDDEVELKSHVVVDGHTTIGKDTIIFPFASIGHVPQDLKFEGEPSTLTIGEHNVIREHVTMNPGTKGGGMKTTVGDHCLFMVGTHVAHDCRVGNHVVMANNATLAGHVVVGDYVVIGGLAAVHQFVRIGDHAMIGGLSGVEGDIIPYGSAMGKRANLVGLNIRGLKRRGFDHDNIHSLRSAYRLLFAPEGTLAERLDDVSERFNDSKLVGEVLDFIRSETQRAICKPDE